VTFEQVWNELSLIIYILASYLEPLKGGKIALEIHVRGKDAEQNKKQFDDCTSIIKAAGVRKDS
jgi:nucleosome binding factor SPN SPT16 subunit